MTNPIDEFDPPEYDELDTSLFFDEPLPDDHRSGFVAVIGRPNVGKSTLMNHFLGQKIAIVSSKPQTTRNQLLGILTLPDEKYPNLAAQVIFVDTPGIHDPKHKLGQFLVDTALEAIPEADVIVWLVDATRPAGEEDKLVANAIQKRQDTAAAVGESSVPVILALNKIDQLSGQPEDKIAQTFLELYLANKWLPISAMRGDNRDKLLEQIVEQLPLGPRYFPDDQVTDQQMRFIAAELVREAALNVLRQEIPHSLAVVVTEFKERHQNLTYVSANIILERKSHKQIVIGQQGKTLKNIGRLARPQIEELTGTKVYLDLWVKIRPKWRSNENELRWLGYTLQ